MKLYCGIIFLMIIGANYLQSQILEIYSGLNISKGWEVRKQFYKPDTTVKHKSLLGYQVGYSALVYKFKVLQLNTGLEIMNSNIRIDSADLYVYQIRSQDTLSFKVWDRDLNVLQVRLPLILKWKIHENFSIETGIAPSYYIRKNRTFFHNYYLLDGTEVVRNYYNKYHFQSIIGVSGNVKKVNFRLNYNFDHVPYFDTGKDYESITGGNVHRRAYGVLHSINFTVGYLFYE